MMCGSVLSGHKLQITAFLLLSIALLAGSWSPVVLLVIVALIAERRQYAAGRRRAEVQS